MLDLVQQARRDVVEPLDLGPHRVLQRHAQDLLVGPLLVGHAEEPDGTRHDVAPREGGLPDEHEGVEGVPVAAEGVGDEAVVRRVLHRGEQHPVEHDGPGIGVPFVLVARALGDLDDHGDQGVLGHGGSLDGGPHLLVAIIVDVPGCG